MCFQSSKGDNYSRWNISLVLSDLLLTCLDDFSKDFDYRDTLTLFCIFRRQFPEDLYKLNNDILVNTLLGMTQKKIQDLKTIKDWFMGLANTLQQGLMKGCLQSFTIPRLNLLKQYNITPEEQVNMLNKIEEIVKDINKDVKTIYRHSGFVEKRTVVSRAGSESSESGDEFNDEENEESLKQVNCDIHCLVH